MLAKCLPLSYTFTQCYGSISHFKRDENDEALEIPIHNSRHWYLRNPKYLWTPVDSVSCRQTQKLKKGSTQSSNFTRNGFHPAKLCVDSIQPATVPLCGNRCFLMHISAFSLSSNIDVKPASVQGFVAVTVPGYPVVTWKWAFTVPITEIDNNTGHGLHSSGGRRQIQQTDKKESVPLLGPKGKHRSVHLWRGIW